ncbi:unnamed protein product [Amoebophrya sp. A120]|nr:unnamed protein product [Amoebophrya sp. A120]|eukprot:GSA120T00019301001.1
MKTLGANKTTSTRLFPPANKKLWSSPALVCFCTKKNSNSFCQRGKNLRFCQNLAHLYYTTVVQQDQVPIFFERKTTWRGCQFTQILWLVVLTVGAQQATASFSKSFKKMMYYVKNDNYNHEDHDR